MANLSTDEQASIASLAQGNLQEVRTVADNIYKRIGALEEKGDQGQPVKNQSVQGIDPIDPPADDAKSVDVRESVIALAERFNQLLDALKNG